VALGGVTLNPITKRYVQTVTLTNNSAATLSGPISLVLNALTAGVTLWNASGTTNLMLPAGSSYINAATNLAPGQSIALQLQFTNSGNVAFSYSPRVLAGPDQHQPVGVAQHLDGRHHGVDVLLARRAAGEDQQA